MAKLIQNNGSYSVPAGKENAGSSIAYDFEYQVFESIEDACEVLGETKALATIQRMVKVDANNIAREKAKTLNGHSTRRVLTEEEKAEKKVQRSEDRSLLEALKAKGLSISDIENL